MSASTPSKIEAFNNKELLINIWQELSSIRKRQIILLTFSLILNGIAEVLSLIIFLPFISILINSDNFIKSNYSNYIPNSIINNESWLLISTSIIFIFTIILTASIRLFNLHLNCKISALIGNELSTKTYKKNLQQPFQIHCQRNSSEIINATTRYAPDILIVINSFLTILSSIIISISIIFSLFLINWKISLITILSFGTIYLFIARYTSKKLHRNSLNIARESSQQIRTIQEGLGGIKDIILENSYNFYLKIYQKSDRGQRFSQASNQFLTYSPRLIVESFGLILIAVIAITVSLNDSNNGRNILPIIGTFALGAQKLIPSLQQIYSGWASIRSCSSGVSILIKMMQQKTNNFSIISYKKPYKLGKSIVVNNLSFSYNKGSKKILKNINFEITKGSKVGFIGKTGSGKSTVVDILMGLLKPTSGEILIDGNDLNLNKKDFQYFWRSSIAHVPQNIYLADCDISENIAFGISRSKIDFNRVKKSAKLACLSEFIESCPRKYSTFVGERGIKLSGGEKQRLGLARAFYKRKKIIVLDEATSALDYITESKVMDSIYKLEKDVTLIIIAHRLKTLEMCDKVIELDNGSIIRISNGVDIQ
nr:ABC transporter ATP-binding protein [Prochlorococcus marinus]